MLNEVKGNFENAYEIMEGILTIFNYEAEGI